MVDKKQIPQVCWSDVQESHNPASNLVSERSVKKKKKTTVWYGDTHTQVNHLCTLQKAPGLKLTKPLSPFGQNRRPSYPQMTQEFVSVCLRGCRITKHTLSTPLCSVTVTVCTFFLYRRNDITESSSGLDGDAGKTGCLGESSDPERKRRWKGRTNKNRGKCCSPPLCLIPLSQRWLCVAVPPPPLPLPLRTVWNRVYITHCSLR